MLESQQNQLAGQQGGGGSRIKILRDRWRLDGRLGRQQAINVVEDRGGRERRSVRRGPEVGSRRQCRTRSYLITSELSQCSGGQSLHEQLASPTLMPDRP